MDLKTIALGLLVLGGLIILHELGHFLAARRMGLVVPEFSVGFGPRLFGWTWGETEYSFRLFPLGGYVLLPDLAPEPGERAQPIHRRFLTILAGPLANIALVVLILGPSLTLRGAGMWGVLLFDMLRDLVAGAPTTDSFVGPLGVSEMVGQAAHSGWEDLIRLTAVLSLNLGLFNLLPFPGLDGGRLLSLLIEKLNGGRRAAWEPVLQGVGLLLFLGLGLWVTGREIIQYVF